MRHLRPTKQTDPTLPPITRSIEHFERQTYDLVVVGAGIYGLWVALDAARRGLSVVLIDQGDFCAETSANSQHIIHGGFRYLQHGNLRRMRESIRERRYLFREMPHLMESMPFLVPTFGSGLQSRFALRLALKMNDWISYDRNDDVHPSRWLPDGRLIDDAERNYKLPTLPISRVNGGAIFYDGQIGNTERLAIAILRSAVAAGAMVANYCRVERMIREGGRVVGVEVQDVLTSLRKRIRARLVVSCVGPWTAMMLTKLTGDKASPPLPELMRRFDVFRAVVLVTRQIIPEVGLVVPAAERYQDRHEILRKGFRNLFVVPRHDCSLLGTFYSPHTGSADTVRLSAQEIESYLDQWNQAFPDGALAYDDVYFAYVGLLPQAQGVPPDDPQYDKSPTILDHEKLQNLPGLISVVGVKWTTARHVANKTVDLACRKLNHMSVSLGEGRGWLSGGNLERIDEIISLMRRELNLDETTLQRWAATYGEGAAELLDLCRRNTDLVQEINENAHLTRAEVIHAVQFEAAQALTDVVLRRTGLGKMGYPGVDTARAISKLMAGELGWDNAEIDRQMHLLQQDYKNRGLKIDG